ncbi:MAG: hypothetical protein JXA77_05255 [Bacteroidales bacterium]|nr:hypothetical protein [Bacteroidales bacterium]MBN2820456.1 hypothetical protein [Bacteroidales bacterium]
MKFCYAFFVSLLLQATIIAQDTPGNIYLFPGQGADARIFQELKLNTAYQLNFISYPVPERGSTLSEFASSFIPEIDTAKPYVLIGQSIGGMICTELADTLNPDKVIIISSAKTRYELPFRYSFQKYIPLYRIFPRGIIKLGGRILQPIVEPDTRKENRPLFKSMICAKDSKYLKRTIGMIVSWNRISCNEKIIHIHGDEDHTIPIRKVNSNYKISKGSHVMVYTRSNEINEILNSVLSKELLK